MYSAALMKELLSLQRETVTQDSSGGSLRSFATVTSGSGIPCAVQPANAFTVATYARQDIVISHMIYTVTDLDSLASGGVKANDRFLAADNTTVYVIKGVRKQKQSAFSATALYEIAAEERRV